MTAANIVSPAASVARSYDFEMAAILKAAIGDASPDAFASQWLRLSAAIDVLRSLMEDSYVDATALNEEVSQAINAATDDPTRLLEVARKVALLEPLTPFKRRRVVCTPAGRLLEYLIRVAPSDGPPFLVASGETRVLPILDDSLSDPQYSPGVIRAYIDSVMAAQKNFGISYLIFIDKNFGPVGALGLISSLSAATGLPVTIHRERKWSKTTDFSGYAPSHEERGLIIYDLINTGTAIRATSTRVFERFGSRIVAATVLFALGNIDKELMISDDGDVVRIDAFDSVSRISKRDYVRLYSHSKASQSRSEVVSGPRTSSEFRLAALEENELDHLPKNVVAPGRYTSPESLLLDEDDRAFLAALKTTAARRAAMSAQVDAPGTSAKLEEAPEGLRLSEAEPTSLYELSR
jgi:hypothetical protein